MIKEFKDLLSNKDDLDILFKKVLKLKLKLVKSITLCIQMNSCRLFNINNIK